MKKQLIRVIPVWIVTTATEDVRLTLSEEEAQRFATGYQKHTEIPCTVEEREAVIRFPSVRKASRKSA